MNDETEFLTLTEVAELLRLHPSTVRRLVAKGYFPQPLMLGTTLRFSRQKIDEFVEKQNS